MWIYKDQKVDTIEDLPETAYGFVYEVVHNESGKKYVGKKVLFFERNVKLGKRELKQLQRERKEEGKKGRVPKKKKVIKESDWKTYYGSQKEIRELLKKEGPQAFTREIIEIGRNKKHLTYLETKLLFSKGVLESEEYLNDNILGKFYSKDLVDL